MWLIYAIISVFFFAATNIFDSLFMNKYEKRPVVYLFHAALLMMMLLVPFAFFWDVRSDWMVLLVITTCIAYIGDLFYFYVLGRVDVSVTSAYSAVLAVFVSMGGFLLFDERWSLSQGVGAVLILGGILLLSYWHKHVSILRTVGLFSAVAIFIAPVILVEKAALSAGESAITVIYWVIMGRNLPNLLVPILRAEWREGIRTLPQRVHPEFYFLVLSAILVWFSGMYAAARAFELGLVSLASIVGNVQPFFVIFLAWMVLKLFPQYAPRELLTAQSVRVKLVSFGIVFVGLGLLAVG